MLKGKVGIITGSSAGIGAEIAYKFAQEGADGITLHGRRPDALEGTKKRLVDGGYDANKVNIVIGDITNVDTHKKLVEETVTRFGRLDILVNNAGIFKFAQLSDENVQQVFKDHLEANLLPIPALTKVAIPALQQSKGNIINITTNLTLKIFGGTVAYATSKAALNHMSKAAALELGPIGIRVNVICPGYIPGTDLNRASGFSEESRQKVEDDTKTIVPLRRNGTVQDIANGVAFLASDNASFITGVVLAIDGGWHLT